MGFWALVKLVLTLLPDLISLIKAAGVFVGGQLDEAATKKRMSEYVAASKKAMETGDTSGVEDLFRRPK